MKVKKVFIGIKGLDEVFKDARETMKAIQKGKPVKARGGPELYFTSFEVFRKALTPKRLELLHIIKTRKPASINELARMADRDIKNVADDVKYLGEIGLIESIASGRKTAPKINYDRIALEIAV